MQQANPNLFEDDCPINLYIESPYQENQWFRSFNGDNDSCQLINLPEKKQEETNANRQSKNLSLSSQSNLYRRFTKIEGSLKRRSLRNKQVDEKKLAKLKPTSINQKIQGKQKLDQHFQTMNQGKSSKILKKTSSLDDPCDHTIMKSFDVGKSQKKNTNFVKFIANHFYEKFPIEMYTDDLDLVGEFNQLSEVFATDKARQANRKWLNELFVKSQKQQIYRQFMFHLLNNRGFLNKNILKRNYMRGPNKKQYLLCSKVFKLRCRCKRLSDRVETR